MQDALMCIGELYLQKRLLESVSEQKQTVIEELSRTVMEKDERIFELEEERNSLVSRVEILHKKLDRKGGKRSG